MDRINRAVAYGTRVAMRYRGDKYPGRMMLSGTEAAEVHNVLMFHAAWDLMDSPESFMLPELRRAYEELLGRELDPRNFQRDMQATGLVKDTGERRTGGRGKPAGIYTRAEA